MSECNTVQSPPSQVPCYVFLQMCTPQWVLYYKSQSCVTMCLGLITGEGIPYMGSILKHCRTDSFRCSVYWLCTYQILIFNFTKSSIIFVHYKLISRIQPHNLKTTSGTSGMCFSDVSSASNHTLLTMASKALPIHYHSLFIPKTLSPVLSGLKMQPITS